MKKHEQVLFDHSEVYYDNQTAQQNGGEHTFVFVKESNVFLKNFIGNFAVLLDPKLVIVWRFSYNYIINKPPS